MKYKCDQCSYETDDKSNLNRHIKSSAHCLSSREVDNDTTSVDNDATSVDNMRLPKFNCEQCNKYFSYRQSLSRHNKRYHANIQTPDVHINVNVVDDDSQDANEIIYEKDQMINDLKSKIIKYKQLMEVKEIQL